MLDKYSDYRKRIEEQTGKKMTDFEFLSGIMEARRDSLNHQAETYFASNKEANVSKPKCSTCQSEYSKNFYYDKSRECSIMGNIFAKD